MTEWHLIFYIALAEGLLHYIPWREFLGGHDLPRPIAYALGVCGFAIPLSFWLAEHGYMRLITILWMSIITAGVAVLSAYGADSVKGLYWGKREADERVEAMSHGKEK